MIFLKFFLLILLVLLCFITFIKLNKYNIFESRRHAFFLFHGYDIFYKI